MLNSCTSALVVVEGDNDYALISGLIGTTYSVKMARKGLQVATELRRCSSNCVVVYPVGGLGNIRSTALPRHIYYMASISTGLSCLVVLVDSDEDEPAERVNKLEERLNKLIREKYRGGQQRYSSSVNDRYLAYTCFSSGKKGVPVLCIASWRCSAECWLATAIDECEITSVDECKQSDRNKCKECITSFLRPAREKFGGEIGGDEGAGKSGPEKLVEIVKNALSSGSRDPWLQGLINLRQRLLDGEHEAPSTHSS